MCEALHPQFGAPHVLYTYCDATGSELFHVARYEQDGAAHRVVWTYDGQCWRAKGWPAPRPLYNLPAIGADPDSSVLIVADERTAEFMRHMEGQRVTVTWSGGADALTHTDWLPVRSPRHDLAQR